VRIVSLLPSATEMLFAIGADDEIVGVTHECDFPPEALKRPKLTASALPHASTSSEIDRHVRAHLHAGSSLYSLNAELLERLAPDLIVTQELCDVCAVSYAIVDRAAKRLQGDPRIVSLEPSSLDDVMANVTFLGELTDHSDGARGVVDEMTRRVTLLRQRPRNARRPRTLVLEWTDPPMSGGHWVPGLVELAGGEPILAHPGANSQRLEWREIAAADPDAVVVAPCGFDLQKTEAAVAELGGVPEWRELRAVQRGVVLTMDGNAYLSRPGPRLVDTAEQIADFLASL
jgi:iron complex transport system substrate-binding protein